MCHSVIKMFGLKVLDRATFWTDDGSRWTDQRYQMIKMITVRPLNHKCRPHGGTRGKVRGSLSQEESFISVIQLHVLLLYKTHVAATAVTSWRITVLLMKSLHNRISICFLESISPSIITAEICWNEYCVKLDHMQSKKAGSHPLSQSWDAWHWVLRYLHFVTMRTL